MLKQIPARGFDLSSGTNLDRPAIDLSWFANRMQQADPRYGSLKEWNFSKVDVSINSFAEKNKKAQYIERIYMYTEISIGDEIRARLRRIIAKLNISAIFIFLYIAIFNLRIWCEIFCVENNVSSMKTFSVFDILPI